MTWNDSYLLYSFVDEPSINLVLKQVSNRFPGLSKNIQHYPHITIFQALRIRDNYTEDTFFQTITDCAKPFDFLPYSINGYQNLNSKNSGQVIAHRVIPAQTMNDFIESMVNKLELIADGTWTDFHREDNHLHITIAWRLYQEQFHAIYGAFSNHSSPLGGVIDLIRNFPSLSVIKPIRYDFQILRLAVRKNRTIVGEYDFPRRIWVAPEKMWDRKEWGKTHAAFIKAKNHLD